MGPALPAASWESFLPSERWSRGCGAGIGLSEHKTSFRYGVLSGQNWVEERHAQDSGNKPPLEMGYQKPPAEFATTTRASFRPDGKVGMEVMESVGVAEDIKFARRGAGRAAMFSHHPPMAEEVTSFITTKELHFSEPSLDKAKAQAGLWSGSTMHNVHVPVGTLRPSSRLPGVGGGFEDRFETTAGATLGSTARAVMAGHAERRQPITQDGAKEGGQRAQVGRKPKGEFSAAPDAKAWRAPLRTK